MSEKVRLNLRISVELFEQIEKLSDASGKSKTSIIEEALARYFEVPDRETELSVLADIFLDKYAERYNNTLTRIRLAANTAERNTQTMIDLKNTELFKNKTLCAADYVSEHEFACDVLKTARDDLKSRIALMKQKKDNKPGGKY